MTSHAFVPYPLIPLPLSAANASHCELVPYLLMYRTCQCASFVHTHICCLPDLPILHIQRYVSVATDPLQAPLFKIFEMLFQIPSEDILTYPKLSKTYFALIGDLFERSTSVFQHMDTPSFLKLCESLQVYFIPGHLHLQTTGPLRERPLSSTGLNIPCHT